MGEAAMTTSRAGRTTVVIAVVVSLLAVYAVRSADPDLWGHLRYGKHILDNGGRVGADPFAYTAAGQVWNDHEYLAQMALWLAYAAAGPYGLILLKFAIGAATLFVVYRTLRLGSDDPQVWAPLLVLFAAGLGRWLTFRPQLFTFLLLAVFVLTLMQHLVGLSSRLWLLPPLTALWVNLHGGFLAGIGAVGLALILRSAQSICRNGQCVKKLSRSTLPLILTLVGCLAGSLLNPLGWRLWPYLRTELSFAENRVYIQEWQPIWRAWDLWLALVPFFLLLIVLIIAAIWRRSDRIADLPAWVWLLSCVPLTWMAFQSNRHIPVQLVWVTPVVGILTSSRKDAAQASAALGWRRGLAPIAVLAGLLAVIPVLLDPLPRILVGPSAFGATRPERAAEFLRVNGIKGNLYTPLWWGSYLTWELYPDVLVSADGRNVTLFSRETVLANFRFYIDQRPDLEIPLANSSGYLLIPADTPGLVAVHNDKRWAVLYEDRDAVLFVRANNREMLRRRDHGELRNPTGEAVGFFP